MFYFFVTVLPGMVYYCPQYYPILISRYNHQKSGLCFEFGHPIALPPGWTVWQSRPRYPMTSLLWSSTLLPGCSSVATSPPSGGTGPLSHQGSAFPPIHWELSGVRMLRSFGMIVVMGGCVVGTHFNYTVSFVPPFWPILLCIFHIQIKRGIASSLLIGFLLPLLQSFDPCVHFQCCIMWDAWYSHILYVL